MDETSEPLFEHHKIAVDRQQGACRIDKFLLSRLPSTSRTRIQAGIKGGYVQVDGHTIKPSYQVKPGDVIQVLFPNPPREASLVPEEIPLDIVYQDSDLLLVNKEAAMVVHPGFGNWTGTLANGLLYYLRQLPSRAGNELRPGLLHRLDKGTSGLLAVAKTDIALRGLTAQFLARTIQRTYLALVWGNLSQAEGMIDKPIGRNEGDRRMMVVYDDETKGKRSVTHYKVLEEFEHATLIQCRLETGRTHQIRVHMKWLGHPLFGDPVYGGRTIVKGQASSKYKAFVHNCLAVLPFQALHAQSLGFLHPVSQKMQHFEVPLPLSFAQVLEKWRRYMR